MADFMIDFNIKDKHHGAVRLGFGGGKHDKIATDLTQLIGNTPMLSMERFVARMGAAGEIVAKLEYLNPLGSSKDRVAFNLIKSAENAGKIRHGDTIIEATSGNTGIGLAYVGNLLGYKIVIVMPDNASIERIKIMNALGAEVILIPAADGMSGAVEKAKAIAEERQGYLADQFNNPDNADAHRKTTAVEILRDTYGLFDGFVAGVGTGGTLCGTASVLKGYNPDVKIFAVEPTESPVLKGSPAGAHGIAGIGANFIHGNYDASVVDEVLDVSAEQAVNAARLVAQTEGLLVGISSGAALYAAAEILRRPLMHGKRLVVILPDSGERYLSADLYE